MHILTVHAYNTKYYSYLLVIQLIEQHTANIENNLQNCIQKAVLKVILCLRTLLL